jgi:hypothetical protein
MANKDEFTLGEQDSLFDIEPEWKEHWGGMPEYSQDNLMPWQTIKVHFQNRTDKKAFSELVGQTLGERTQYIWYPKVELAKVAHLRYKTKEEFVPRYPIYIISKSRWDSRLTSKALERMNVPYRIVIEPQEYDNYAEVIDEKKILVLPFSNLGLGSIPVRNWVWEHSISEGHDRHWILDDNIRDFWRLNRNSKIQVETGATFCAIEDFTDRYENVDMSGMNYIFFAKRKQLIPPYYVNTRVYSCILLKNDQPFRWRGRYNEDTDLSLRILKSGKCTLLFNTFLAGKQQTMTMKGGNTDELYQDDGRLQMAESLREQHPDITKVSWKFGRWQHHVDYRGFRKNKLILKEGIDITPDINEYDMSIEIIDELDIDSRITELINKIQQVKQSEVIDEKELLNLIEQLEELKEKKLELDEEDLDTEETE